MIIHNPILTGSLSLNGTNLSTSNLVTTGSNTFVGNQIVSGSLNVSGSVTATGTLTAQTLVVQTITSSVSQVTGSTSFGTLAINTHTFTGSILTSGSVGIGTSSPSVALHVVNGSATTVGLFEYTGGANSYIGIKSTSGTNYIGNVGYDMTFEAGGSEKVRILSGGNVGIGITNPSYKFEVRSSSTTSETIANFQNATNAINRFNIIRIGQGSYAAYVGVCLDTYDTAYFSTNSNPTGALGIYYSTANRLGVNVRQPTNELTLVASSTTTGKGIDFVNYASPSQVIAQLTFEQTGDFLELKHKIAGGGIKFSTYDTERMRITGGGNIGIGTTSPSANLHINAGSGLLTKEILIVQGGGSPSGNYGFSVQANNGDKIFYTDNLTYHVYAGLNGGKLFLNTTTDYSTGPLQVWGGIGINGTISNLGTGTGTYTRSVWYNDGSNQVLFENARTTDSAGGTGRTVYFTWRGGPGVGGGVQLQHGANAWSAYTSDARMKTKVADVENGLDTIMKLNPIKFKWTRELENSRTVTGFTAQNVEEAIPDAVFNSWQDEELGDVKSYYQDYLVPYLVKAIQELKAEIEILKTK